MNIISPIHDKVVLKRQIRLTRFDFELDISPTTSLDRNEPVNADIRVIYAFDDSFK